MPIPSYADPQLDTLLNIATQARDSLGITISQINNVPDEINHLYNQGSNETDELAQAVSQQDVNSAKQHFLAAMEFFKDTNIQINLLNATVSNDQQKIQIIQLRGEITRLENMESLLKSIASQNNVNINFTNFDEMIQTANQDLDSGNLDDASKQVQNANDFIVATHNSLTEAAEEKISARAKDFTEQQIEQLNNTSQSSNNNQLNTTNQSNNTSQSNVTQNATSGTIAAPIANNSNITVENNPKDMAAELNQLVSEGKVDQAINLIKIIQAYQKAQLMEKSVEISPPVNTTSTSPPTPTSPPVNTTSTSPPNSNQTALSGHGTEHNNHGKRYGVSNVPMPKFHQNQ
ncbi:MAG: hypothetical protein ACREBB_05925 [Nitrosotalea sp.]